MRTLVFLTLLIITYGSEAQQKNKNSLIKNIKMENKNVSYFTTGDGCKIAYKIEGNLSKPVLVLSNSIATNFTMWDGQIENFSKYYTIIRFDTRGNGLSDAPVGDYSIARMSLDLIELLDYLQIKQVHFCGLSLGGFIGQWLGIHASDRIDKLILVNTAPYLGPAKLWNENIRILNTQPNMNYFEDMFIRGWFSEDMIVNQKEVVLPFRKMILKTSPVGLAGSYAAVRDSDFRKTNSLITNPTLIIAGKYDEVTKPEHSEQINSAIPQSKLVILPVVHLTNIERKIEFEKLVLDFLENI